MRTIPIFLSLALLLAPSGAGASIADVPDGFRATHVERLARGVEHIKLKGSGLTVNVAAISDRSAVELRAVSSYDRIGGSPRLERTSSMCARVDCIVAVNGDFYREEMPVGAVVHNGELLHSPNKRHHQLMVTPRGRVRAGSLDWSGRLVATDLSQLKLDGVNVARSSNELVLYTPAYGKTTQTNPHGVEMQLRFIAPRAGRLPIGQTAVVRAVAYKHGVGDSRIPADGAILSAHGKSARDLAALWTRMQNRSAGREILLRVETSPRVVSAIGGTPVLLRDGEVWFDNADNQFVRSRHPRTIVGWNRQGDMWLVAIDGRQADHSLGVTLSEAAAFMLSLGATDAINLDGGGSTTFVVEGDVVNRPSDRAVVAPGGVSIARTVARGVRAVNVERPVANALALVPVRARDKSAATPPTLSKRVPTIETLSLTAPSAGDPGSDPTAALPALVSLPFEVPEGRGLPFAAAGLLNFLVAAAVVRALSRRREALVL